MKKGYESDVLSNVYCSCGCGKCVKMNLVSKKQAGKLLMRFECYQKVKANTSNPIVTAKQIRRNPSLQGKKRRDMGVTVRTTY